VISTGLDLRKIFGISSLLIAIPPLLYLLINHGATWLMSALIILSLIPAFFASVSDTLLEVAPKLKQDIKSLQKNQMQASIGRLALTGITIFIFPWAFIAILAGGLPRIWANFRLRKISVSYADLNQKPDLNVKKQILSFVKKIMPGAIYYSISGQITIWLISIFGTTNSIAQIGALGRLTVVLTIVSTIFTSLIVPRFTKLPGNRDLLFKRYIMIHLLMFIISLSIVAICWSFPNQILWILGKSYSGLSTEFLFIVVAACINLIVGISFSLNSNRGWIFNPIIGIAIGLSEIILGIMIFNISTLQGVLYFNLFQAIVGLLIHPSFGMVKILKLSKYGHEQTELNT
jgi:O-antigen/teichoic acid export membrane protein